MARRAKSAQTIVHRVVALIIQVKSRYHPIIIVMIMLTHVINPIIITKQVKVMQIIKIMIAVVLEVVLVLVPMLNSSNSKQIAQMKVALHHKTQQQQRHNRLL